MYKKNICFTLQPLLQEKVKRRDRFVADRLIITEPNGSFRGVSGSPLRRSRETPFLERNLEPESYLVRNNRVSSSENSPRNRRTKSNFPSSATKGDFAWGVVPAIATGVAVTGACNDHSPLSSHHRDSLAATSKTTPSPPLTRENVYGERHVRSMHRKDVVGVRTCVQRIRSDRYVGLWGTFLSVFLYPRFICIISIGNRWNALLFVARSS